MMHWTFNTNANGFDHYAYLWDDEPYTDDVYLYECSEGLHIGTVMPPLGVDKQWRFRINCGFFVGMVETSLVADSQEELMQIVERVYS